MLRTRSHRIYLPFEAKSGREGGGMMLIHAALAIVLFLGLVAAPAATEAQAAAKIHRIGLLESAPPSPAADPFGQWAAFREGSAHSGTSRAGAWRSSRDGPTTSMSGS